MKIREKIYMFNIGIYYRLSLVDNGNNLVKFIFISRKKCDFIVR